MKILPLILSTIGDPIEQQFFTSIYRRFYALMKHRAYILTGDPCMTDDIIQDTLIRLLPLYERLKELDESRLAGYIALTVRSAAYKALRCKYKDKAQINLDKANCEIESPESVFVASEDRDRRKLAVNSLPKAQRELLLQKYLLEKNNAELAELFQTNETNIRQMLSRARKKLCSLLEGI